MISDILDILDRIAKLLTNRGRRKNTDFKEFFDPLFQDLVLVHGDYVKTFDEAQSILESAFTSSKDEKAFRRNFEHLESAEDKAELRKPLSPRAREAGLRWARKYLEARQRQLTRAKGLVEKNRRQYEPVRQKLIALSKNTSKLNSKQEVVFLEAVRDYFFGIEKTTFGGSRYSRFLAGIDQEICENIENIRNVNTQVNTFIDSPSISIPDLRERWGILCEAYASLKESARAP